MNKSAIKTYAVWARTELIKLVTQRAYEYEVTADNTPAYNTDSVHGRPLESEEKKQLNELIDEVNKHGFEHVIEEVAYTWFNRFIALRYMEVNNYLPQKVRVFTNENNEFKPELLTDAIHIELDGLDKQKVFDYIEHNNQEDLYKYLLLTLCNDMNKYLPDMFASISDYKSLLMPNNLLREDSIIGRMITDIDEDSWNDQVQIIGWLYQYYNSELKDIVMKKKSYAKDDIPAATQLFTPDWIVRYMTENSLGRLWLDGHPDFDHSKWKYYLEEAEQEPEVLEQLKKIREEHEKLKPEDIKVIDPCMGSGHILVYAFDVLMDIYRDSGYTDRNAAKSILENNIYGLEIDERAYHLAYFALMMKARSYNRRILSGDLHLNIYEINAPKMKWSDEYDKCLREKAELAHYLVDEFQEAKALGSCIKLSCDIEGLDNLEEYIIDKKESSSLDLFEEISVKEVYDTLMPLIKQAKLLVDRYHVVITNPPYMPPFEMQKTYLKKNYPDSKSDMFAVFIEKCHELTEKNAYQAMITQQSWMFISSYKSLRKKLINKFTIINMAHLGKKSFDEIKGEKVQTSSFILLNYFISKYNGEYLRLTAGKSESEKRKLFLEKKEIYFNIQNSYNYLAGNTISYWAKNGIMRCMQIDNSLGDEYLFREGIHTTDNDEYLKLWYEIDRSKMVLDANNYNDIDRSGRWVPYNKGGMYRKWYGNNNYVIRFDQESRKEMDKIEGHVRPSQELYFKEGATWSAVSGGNYGIRYYPSGFLFDAGGQIAIGNDIYKLMGYLNTNVFNEIAQLTMPTLNYKCGVIKNLPNLCLENNIIVPLVRENIQLSKEDWDSYETSWNFTQHPLVKYFSYYCDSTRDELINSEHEYYKAYLNMESCYQKWKNECNTRFNNMKENEQKLNAIFIDNYELKNEMNSTVFNNDITIHYVTDTKEEVAESFDGSRYVRTKSDEVKSFISYAIGCMFGRYSLDTEGLAYAGGEWDNNKYKTFIPDADDIIPICDEDYFEDDIVSRFIEFVRCVYGDDTLEENLKFISDAIGGNGNPRDVLRNYFLKDFFKDHCNTYQVTGSGKRPIYWQFDSGKKNGFKALVYIHRYTPDLIARMRTGYIHPLQSQYRTQIEMLNNQIDEASSTSEKVRLQKQLKKITEQAEELGKYEEKIHHWADKMEPMDLDDGVVVNYNKFQELLTPNVVKKLKEVKK